MAPLKGPLVQRLQVSQSFLGVKLNKPTFFTPFNNLYPFQMTGGQHLRMYSNPAAFGVFHNRCTLINLRNFVFAIPAIYAGLFVIFDCHPYQMAKFHYDYVLQQPMPQWMEEYWQDLLKWQSWNKPGRMLKHTMGGLVSIPGSEKLVTEL